MKKNAKIFLWSLVGLMTIGCSLQKQMHKQLEAGLDGALATLCESPAYDTIAQADFPAITYADPEDPGIALVRDYFKVDEIAGNGDEISRIKNIMVWVYDNVYYDGTRPYNGERNSIALYEYGKQRRKGLNCGTVAALANELYLAAGFPSRSVECWPKDSLSLDMHVINAVWSRDKGKWLWMDSAAGAYVTDENGELLGVSEVRDRLIRGLPVKINENDESPEGFGGDWYLYKYMAKNLYWFGASTLYGFGTEDAQPFIKSVSLTPPGYRIGSEFAGRYGYNTHNADRFWQAPE